MAEERKVPIFVGIQIISKSVSEMPVDFSVTPIFGFNIRVETRVDAQEHLVMPFVHVTITETKRTEELAKIIVACLFRIVDFEHEITLNQDGLYNVPIEIESLIRPISISTVRGIIYSELRGTHLNNAIMPIIFMDSFTAGNPIGNKL